MSQLQYASSPLRDRTKAFALRIIRLVESLPNTRTASHIGGQLLRAGTSVAANYRAACRARSAAEFIAKLGIVEEESDEAIFWMEMLVDADIVAEKKLAALIQETNEILSMVVSSIRTSRSNSGRPTSKASPSKHSALRTPRSALS